MFVVKPLCTAVRLVTLCGIVMIISVSLSGAVEDAKLRLVLVNFLRREKRCWNVVLEDRVKVPSYRSSHNFVCSDFWISEGIFVLEKFDEKQLAKH